MIWECPNFFQLGEKWVLLISAHTGHSTDTVFYFVGDFVNQRFIPETSAVFDYGTLYAPLSFLNDQGERLLFGWLREARPDAEMRHAGWSGVQSIPRVLSLDAHNRLISTPIAELDKIRGTHYTLKNLALDGETILDASSLHLDIEASFSLAQNGNCSLVLARNPENGEEITISYNRAREILSVRKVVREINGALSTTSREIPHQLDADEPLNLRILLDGSVLELIANGRTSLTSRVYPAQASQLTSCLSGSNAKLLSLDLWEMPSIWQ
jgi:beta-fructofuranosidase